MTGAAPVVPALAATTEASAPAEAERPAPLVSPPAPLGPIRDRGRIDDLGRIIMGCTGGDPMERGGFALRGDACSFHGAVRAMTLSMESVCVDAHQPCAREIQPRLELALTDAPTTADERCPRRPEAPSASTSNVYLTLPAGLVARRLPLAIGETVCGYIDQHSAPYGCGTEEARLSRATGEPIVAYGTARTPSVPGFRFAVGRERSRWPSDGSVRLEMSALVSHGGTTRELFKAPATFAGAPGNEYEVTAAAGMTQHAHVFECAQPIPVVSFSIVQLQRP